MVVIGLYNTKFGAVGGYSVWTLNLAEIPVASVVPVIPPPFQPRSSPHR
jgi:hypothetical protein